MRLAFMGTPDFAVPALQALHAAGHEIVVAYTQPPRPAGRGKALRPSPVQVAAEALGIEVRTPLSLRRNVAEHEYFAALKLDAAVVAAYGLILPSVMLDTPTHGCLNIHASLLPRWRGAAPIQAAILAGDRESGVTIMQMDAGLDTGAMLVEGRVALTPRTTASSLHDDLAAMGARLIVETLRDIPLPRPQPEEGVTYAARLTREDGRLHWDKTVQELDRQVRAMTPWPGTFTRLAGQTIKIGAVMPEHVTSSAAPGTVVDDRLLVACGDGTTLRITRLQRPGRGMMEADAFLRGQDVPVGTRFDLPHA
ncbi:methionyl-tRNA formyltransferase [Gluconacetobacter entanii]|uniref:Methionyl-tRNA formyltransferase n=1 Tax=Gluconacetobacter entanii TaxID=108528 RepID=A0ABT3K930_9PROT|nr:methionyl-tRNA formyltransferase [Gluconacetobacter entanii]MCW4591925.1 methionyl-tRNA formyltransferase [Gluconacetobacter entanii]MCW4593814.1 methionyl-tRNA formyltransferase [Gluconacetobacter entanii]NPC89992.1 methionyl-tRNA formyltransferase [Gluconacetobacter entanii]